MCEYMSFLANWLFTFGKHALEKLITKEINEQLVTPGILTIIQQMGAS